MTLTAGPAIREERVVLHDISWSTYEALLHDLNDRHIFLTYDRGTLEIMSPSNKHERVSEFIASLIRAYAEEMQIEISSYGRSTWRREDLERGLEPDHCFYVSNEPIVRTRDNLDLESDPPPDLAIEAEISRSVMDRLSIYAALGIPELWRWDKEKLTMHQLVSGKYNPIQASLAFPKLRPSDLDHFLGLRTSLSELGLIGTFRKWIRENHSRA